MRRVVVFGGSGFLGRYVVQKLAEHRNIVIVPTRDRVKSEFLKTMGYVGQINPIEVDFWNEHALMRVLQMADSVVYLPGILAENKRQKFDAIHHQLPALIAELFAHTSARHTASAQHMVFVSAIGADLQSKSIYAKTKALGEEAVLKAFPNATMIRPSVIFGPEDQFFNRFAKMAQIMPVLPLIGGGKTLLQPVYVGNVANAIFNVLNNPSAFGKVYELGGPEILNIESIIRYILKIIDKKRLLLTIPYAAAAVLGRIFELFPSPMLTRDQVVLLQYDNVVSKKSLGFSELGIQPTPLEMVVPTYLQIYKKGGQFRPIEI